MGSHKVVGECLLASVDGELEGSLILRHILQRPSSMSHCMLCEHRDWQLEL